VYQKDSWLGGFLLKQDLQVSQGQNHGRRSIEDKTVDERSSGIETEAIYEVERRDDTLIGDVENGKCARMQKKGDLN